MVDVYTGGRPGRPIVLLLSVAGLVVAALGLAWMQVREARLLGKPQAIPGTPLVVRLPRDYVARPDEPGAFVLAADVKRGDEDAPFVRRFRFQYHTPRPFLSAEMFLRRLGQQALGAGVSPPRPAKVGGHDGFQVLLRTALRDGRRAFTREYAIRFATLPGGGLVVVEYIPLLGMNPADLDQFNDVCDAIEFEGLPTAVTPEEIQQQAGMRFPLPENMRLDRVGRAEIAGLRVFGTENDAPAWSLGVYRSWLGLGRKLSALIADAASYWWLADDAADAVKESRGDDGRTIAEVRGAAVNDAELESGAGIVAIYGVSRSPEETLLIYVFSGPRTAESACAAAERLAREIEFVDVDSVPDLKAAETAGRDLAARLAQRGALPRWGRERVETHYRGRSPRGEEQVRCWRAARDRDGDRGYHGESVTEVAGREEQEAWSFDGRAQAYDFRLAFYQEDRPMAVHEVREAAGGVVRRERTFGRRRLEPVEFRTGPAFVCPPAAGVVEGWIARENAGAALLEYSLLLGRGTHSVWVRPLPPDGPHPRALIQNDYWPQGYIKTFDDPRGEEMRIDSLTATMERVDP